LLVQNSFFLEFSTLLIELNHRDVYRSRPELASFTMLIDILRAVHNPIRALSNNYDFKLGNDVEMTDLAVI